MRLYNHVQTKRGHDRAGEPLTKERLRFVAELFRFPDTTREGVKTPRLQIGTGIFTPSD
jgi:hypothetical protein